MFAVGMLDGRDGVFIISNMRLCACVSACVRAGVAEGGARYLRAAYMN